MAESWKELGEKVKELAGPWTVYMPLGSVALYLVGYLALRFHLTALGIGTDLTVLDERYLFTGAKFLVYLVSSVPTVGLGVLLLVGLVWLPYWLVSAVCGARLRQKVGAWWQGILVWWTAPTRLALTGVVLAIGLIQFVMRQCFVFSNLLLAPRLPEPVWLCTLLLAETDGPRALYFAGLVAGTAVTGGLGLVAWRQRGHTTGSRLLLGMLTFLVGVQLLLLPVNYGILIADKTMPRVINLGGHEALRAGQDAWLVWEGKDGVTYLVRGLEGGKKVHLLGHTGEVWAVAVAPDNRTLVSGSDDQTIRLWDLASGANLLTIFVGSDQEWVAWTPQGYYTSSLKGDSYIGWHLNQGEGQAAKYYSASQFQQQFYRPDVVAAYLQSRDITQAVQQANAKRGQDSRGQQVATAADIPAILPPLVYVMQPEQAETQVRQERLQFKALVQSNTLPITDVQVTLNGVQIAGRPGERPKGNPHEWVVELEVPLQAGDNILSIVAATEKARSEPRVRKIFYQPPGGSKLVDSDTPNLFLLAIGIAQYQHDSMKLRFADADARDLVTLFKQQEGKLFGQVVPRLLVNQEASRQAILRELRWLNETGTARDIRVLFISGHGDTDTDFWERVLKITGVSATPSGLKGNTEETTTGDIWIVTLAQGVHQRLTSQGTYRSPVFLRGDDAILALQADHVVRIPAYGGEAQAFYPLAGVVKLVGVSKDDPDKMLILTRDAQGQLAAGLLSLREGQVAPVASDRTSQKDQSMLAHLAGWDRQYDQATVSVSSVPTAPGAKPRTDVYLKRGNTEPVNLSTCDGATCGQPSLSHDGNRVVFVKTAQP